MSRPRAPLSRGRHAEKVRASVEEALEGLEDGARVMVGGFGLSGNAEALIRGVLDKGVRELTLITNNAGTPGHGIFRWFQAGIVRRFVGCYVGPNELLGRAIEAGTIEVELVPQGTFAERIRAAGAGIAGFYTRTGAGTPIAEGKETRLFGGEAYLLEEALSADLALVRAHRADRFGNLRFYRMARNFSPLMAMAARTSVVEVDELVEPGAIDPDDVHLPGAFVHRLLEVREHDDPLEREPPPRAGVLPRTEG